VWLGGCSIALRRTGSRAASLIRHQGPHSPATRAENSDVKMSAHYV